MSTVYDLSIVNGDLAFGADGEPLFLADADAIAQDIKHRLEALGLTVDLVGDDAPAGGVLRRIAFAVEEDTRIRPGTAGVQLVAPGNVQVQAQTVLKSPILVTV